MYLANNTSMLTNYIKYKLSNMKFPKLLIWNPTMLVIKDNLYIVGENISKANKSGEVELNDFTIVSKFRPDLLLPIEYNTFKSNNSYYDSITHYYLGELLRQERDINNKDLLGMLNVWGGATIENMELTYEFTGEPANIPIVTIHDRESKIYDIMRVDIRPNTDYSIFIESDLPVVMTTIAYDKNQILIKSKTLGSKIVPSTQYTRPITYRVDITEEDLENPSTKTIKDYMTLIIQVPKNRKKRLILEGNYDLMSIDGTISDIISTEPHKLIPAIDKFISDNENILFSDTLVSYMVDHAITNTDEITKNIERIQEQTSTIGFKNRYGTRYTGGVTGEFDENLRLWLIELSKKFKNTEITGYVDTDLEYIIDRGAK